MRHFLFLLLIPGVVVALPPQAPVAPQQAPQTWAWPSPVPRPEGSVRYDSTDTTQAISINTNLRGERGDVIAPVKVERIEDAGKWSNPGGLEGITGWVARKYRLIPEGKGVRYEVKDVQVHNGVNYQPNKAITRAYPDGSRFDEILIREDGAVFEHRMRRKEDGKWISRVLYKNDRARPEGYTGLKVTCSSCHDEAGTGKYGEGMVPGGDTVISDPLDWSVWKGRTR